jgi:RNA polymerase sigma-70 factor (ECF subfamily)
MMEECDALAVAKAQMGDQAAFRILVERHSHDLFRLVYRMTGNEADAEDMVQETFLRAYRNLARFEARASFKTWLHRIAANCALDLLRRRASQERRCVSVDPETEMALERLVDQTPSPHQALCHAEMAQTIEAALGQLTAMERAAFVLRHFENRSIAEISHLLDLGQSAAKQAIFRAVQKVRRTLEPVMRSTKCDT